MIRVKKLLVLLGLAVAGVASARPELESLPGVADGPALSAFAQTAMSAGFLPRGEGLMAEGGSRLGIETASGGVLVLVVDPVSGAISAAP